MPVSSIKSLLELEVEMSGWSEAEAAASSLESTLNDLEGGIDIGISFDAEPLPFDDIPDEISPTIDVQETEQGKQILDGLNFLVLKEKFELVMDIVGTVWDFLGKVENFLVEPFLNVEDAVARINAQTGTAIPDLDQLIRDLQAADLGESAEQIGDVLIAAQQLEQPMREAATAALTFTHTWTEEDPTAVLTTFSDLVKTGLVANLQEAADLMTVFFQQGGNKAGDALSTVEKYAGSWADMNLTFTEGLSLVSSLMTGGVDSAEAAAKMVQTFDDNLTIAADDPASEQAKMLKMMGITNPKDIGAAIGAETIEGFVSKFTNLPADQQDLASGLFFGRGGKLNTGAIAGATTQGGMFADVIGAADAAATEIDNSLRGAIDDFVLEINTSIARLLSSDELDLPGKIADLKEAFQAAAETLASGGSIGDALSVGFHIEGVDTALTNIERIFGNLLIGLLQVVALVQQVQGVDNTGTKAEIAKLSLGQLTFDLKVANPDEVSDMLALAASRGVDNAGLNDALRTSLDEVFASGDFAQGIDILQAVVDANIANGFDPSASQALMGEYVTQLQTGFDTAIADGDFDVAKKIADAQDDPTAFTDALKGKFGFDAAAFDADAAAFTQGMEDQILGHLSITPDDFAFEGVKVDAEEATTAIKTFNTDTETAMTNAALTTSLANESMMATLAAMSDGFVSTEEQVALMDQGIANSLTGNTVTASFEAVEDTAVLTMAGVIRAVQSVTPHILQLDALLKAVAAAAATVQNSVNTAVAGAGAGAGGGGNTTNINVTNTNNVQSPAQASASGYELGKAVRGMG